jgi:hypothetical protein
MSVPGLLTLPNGSPEAFFGAAEPGTSDASPWGITSPDGGKTWPAPVDIRSGPLEDLADSAQFRAEMNGTTPVLILTVPRQGRDYEAIAGRDRGPGVFGAYITDDSPLPPRRRWAAGAA